MVLSRSKELYQALKAKGYPDDFCRELAYRQLNTDYTAGVQKKDSSSFQKFSRSKVPLIPDFPLIQPDMKSKERKVHGLLRIIF